MLIVLDFVLASSPWLAHENMLRKSEGVPVVVVMMLNVSIVVCKGNIYSRSDFTCKCSWINLVKVSTYCDAEFC